MNLLFVLKRAYYNLVSVTVYRSCIKKGLFLNRSLFESKNTTGSVKNGE